jgi:hypothetical protein
MAEGNKATLAAGVVAVTAMAAVGKGLVHSAPKLVLEHPAIVEKIVIVDAAKNASEDVFKGGEHVGLGFHPNRETFDAFRYSHDLQIGELGGDGRLGSAAERLEMQTLPRVLVVPHDRRVDSYSSYFVTAQAKMVDDITALHPPLSIEEVDGIIRKDVGAVIEDAKKSDPEAKISFEIMTGKLNIEAAKTLVEVKISGGEINVYKISLSLAGGIAACSGRIVEEFRPCVPRELAKVGGAVEKELSYGVEEPK